MNALTIAALGGLGAMLGWGLGDFFAKLAIDRVGELTTLAWGHLAGTAFLVVAGLPFVIGSGSTPNSWSISATVICMLFGVAQAAVYYLLYRGFARGKVSVLSPTFASFSGLVAVVSVFALGESVSPIKVVVLLALFGGVVALSIAPNEDGSRAKVWGAPGLGITLIATVLAAGWTLGWNAVVAHHDPLVSALTMYAAMTAVIVVGARSKHALIRIPGRMMVTAAAIGAGEAIAYLSISWAYSRSDATSVTALLSGAFSLPTIICARVWLKERLSTIALAGAGATLAAISALAVVR